MTDFDKDTYPTPDVVFEPLNAEFRFTVDGAASANNTKVQGCFITAEMDFLRYPVENERIWVNPPYSKPLPFVKRAVELFEEQNCLVVMLLPVDVSTEWFELITKKATEIRFIVGGRVKFQHPQTGAWMDVSRGNVVAIFNPAHRKMQQVIRHININDFGRLPWRKN